MPVEGLTRSSRSRVVVAPIVDLARSPSALARRRRRAGRVANQPPGGVQLVRTAPAASRRPTRRDAPPGAPDCEPLPSARSRPLALAGVALVAAGLHADAGDRAGEDVATTCDRRRSSRGGVVVGRRSCGPARRSRPSCAFRRRRTGACRPRRTGTRGWSRSGPRSRWSTVLVLFGLTYADAAVGRRPAPGGVSVHVDRVPLAVAVRLPRRRRVRIVGPTGRSREMVVPVGEPVHVTLTSADVIHSFYVPAFLFKRDAIPGHPNRFDFTVEMPGDVPRQLRRVLRRRTTPDAVHDPRPWHRPTTTRGWRTQTASDPGDGSP